MTARIIDGKVIAAELRARVADEVARVKREHQLTPGLAVVLVGSDPASQVYVRSKHKQTQEAGMASFEHMLPDDVAQADLLALIAKLNGDPAVHGILVQLPLPKSIHTETVINAIDPAKDVDGLHPNNAGRLAGGFAALSPCTPLGCIILTKSVHASLEGMNAIVIGRSNLVGRPLVQLLLNENATVTIAHSRSKDLPQLCARADLVYAAVGKPEMVRADWIKPGATVIDVGINRTAVGRRQDPAGRRRRLQGSGRSCRRDHAGARRRRADDGGVPAGEYAAGGVRILRCRSRGCEPRSLPVIASDASSHPRTRRGDDGLLRASRPCKSGNEGPQYQLTPPHSRSAADRTGSCPHSLRREGVRWCRGSASNLPNWRAPARSGKSCR